MPRLETVILDLDGTLTDPKVGITTCCQYGLRAVGVDVPDLKELEQDIQKLNKNKRKKK